MDFILMLIVVFSASFSIFYSFKARSYRKQGHQLFTSFYGAKTNVAMGLMLVAMALIQLFTFPEPSGWRVGIGILFLLLGSFNVFMGIRNYQNIRLQLDKEA